MAERAAGFPVGLVEVPATVRRGGLLEPADPLGHQDPRVALAVEEPLKQTDLDVPVVLPVPPVAEMLVAGSAPEQRDDAPPGPELEVADGGHATASSGSADLTRAPPNILPGPTRPAG